MEELDHGLNGAHQNAMFPGRVFAPDPGTVQTQARFMVAPAVGNRPPSSADQTDVSGKNPSMFHDQSNRPMLEVRISPCSTINQTDPC